MDEISPEPSSSGDGGFVQPPQPTAEVASSSDVVPIVDDICDSTTADKSKKEKNSNSIIEGKAEILAVDANDHVFYNPVQEFNRDLSIAVLSVFSQEYQPKRGKKRTVKGELKINGSSKDSERFENNEGISILEALSATGLRSIRFALEVIPTPREIIANDISPNAVESIRLNTLYNNVAKIVKTSQNDASLAMHMFTAENKRFDAVDLDPYGCPSRFLDAMVQVVEDGGLAMVTCTDMAVLAGNTPETCYIKYGAISLRNASCHEMALRIALQCVQSHANRYGRYVVPLLSISADFYIRLFFRIFSSPSACKDTTSNLSHMFQCVGCKSFTLQPLGIKTLRENKPPLYSLPRFQPLTKCPHCNHQYQMGGPIWSGPLHDRSFVGRVIEHVRTVPDRFKTSKRIEGMLSLILSEIEDAPLYYSVDALCSTVHCEVIPLIHFRSALLNAGYLVSESHAASNAVKTNAPTEVIWNVVRAWEKDHPVAEKRLQSCQVTKAILREHKENIENDQEKNNIKPIDFTFHPHAKPPTLGLLRYQVNPTKNWGPGVRSTNNAKQDAPETKKKTKQSKKKNQTPEKSKKEDSNEEDKT